jgi:hypothetical protein
LDVQLHGGYVSIRICIRIRIRLHRSCVAYVGAYIHTLVSRHVLERRVYIHIYIYIYILMTSSWSCGVTNGDEWQRSGL